MKTIKVDIIKELFSNKSPAQIQRAADMVFGLTKKAAEKKGEKLTGIKSLVAEIEIYED